jgi:hypothetical protein
LKRQLSVDAQTLNISQAIGSCNLEVINLLAKFRV